ncbi:aldo/keto reductase family protein [Pantoea ananatis]|nr:aldo/keto reductase family protein [Pantoea ananatis]
MAQRLDVAGHQGIPAIGLGTWYMGEDSARLQQEVTALQAGLDAGLKIIDTAEMYADGRA